MVSLYNCLDMTFSCVWEEIWWFMLRFTGHHRDHTISLVSCKSDASNYMHFFESVFAYAKVHCLIINLHLHVSFVWNMLHCLLVYGPFFKPFNKQCLFFCRTSIFGGVV